MSSVISYNGIASDSSSHSGTPEGPSNESSVRLSEVASLINPLQSHINSVSSGAVSLPGAIEDISNCNICLVADDEEPVVALHYRQIGEGPERNFSTQLDHEFHPTCIDKWMKSTEPNFTCPTCRQPVESNNLNRTLAFLLSADKRNDLADFDGKYGNLDRFRILLTQSPNEEKEDLRKAALLSALEGSLPPCKAMVLALLHESTTPGIDLLFVLHHPNAHLDIWKASFQRNEIPLELIGPTKELFRAIFDGNSKKFRELYANNPSFKVGAQHCLYQELLCTAEKLNPRIHQIMILFESARVGDIESAKLCRITNGHVMKQAATIAQNCAHPDLVEWFSARAQELGTEGLIDYEELPHIDHLKIILASPDAEDSVWERAFQRNEIPVGAIPVTKAICKAIQSNDEDVLIKVYKTYDDFKWEERDFAALPAYGLLKQVARDVSVNIYDTFLFFEYARLGDERAVKMSKTMKGFPILDAANLASTCGHEELSSQIKGAVCMAGLRSTTFRIATLVCSGIIATTLITNSLK